MKDHLVFQLKQRKNQDQNGQYGGGFQTQGKSTMGKKNQIPNLKFWKIVREELKKDVKQKEEVGEGDFYRLIFRILNLFEISFLIFDF